MQGLAGFPESLRLFVPGVRREGEAGSATEKDREQDDRNGKCRGQKDILESGPSEKGGDYGRKDGFPMGNPSEAMAKAGPG